MKKKFFPVIAGLAIISTTMYVSCKKTETVNKTENRQALQTMTVKYQFKDLPTVENGMLKFRDDDHYFSYLQFLDNAVSGIDSTDTVSDEHSVLQDIENGLNFTSIRKSTHESYLRQDAIGWESLNAIPDEDFVADPEIRSTLNTSRNVKIGDEILHYISKDFSVRVNADNPTLLSSYSRMPTTATLEGLSSLDPSKASSTIFELTGDSRIFGGIKGNKPTGDANIGLPKYYYLNRCNQPTTVTFYDLTLFGGGGTFHAWFKINYGDGSPIEIKESSISGGIYRVPEFSHTYPAIGTYTMTIIGSNSSNFDPQTSLYATASMSVNISGGGFECAKSYKESGWQYRQVTTGYGYIGGKLVMQNIGSSTNRRLRIVAYSKLVKLKADGTYSSWKGEMYTTISGAVKNDACVTQQNVQGSWWNSKASSQTLHRTPNYDATWRTMMSNHYYIGQDGIQRKLQIILTPCD